MPAVARTTIEAALRARKLDHTLTATLPAPAKDAYELAPSGIPSLDARLSGGVARGHVSEIVGAHTSGRTSLTLQAVAAATLRGELVGLVDTLDRLDITSAAAAGVDLERLLWIRGRVTSHPGPGREANRRALDQMLKALTLVLQARTCDLVVFDVADVPPSALRALPFTTWLRVHRMIEGSRTACLLVSPVHLWRSPEGVTLDVSAKTWQTTGGPLCPSHVRLFTGLAITARITRARIQHHEPLCVSLSTTCA